MNHQTAAEAFRQMVENHDINPHEALEVLADHYRIDRDQIPLGINF